MMRSWLHIMLVAWAAQVVALGYVFANLTWENYWLCRWLYRPGLRCFTWLGRGALPGHWFSPFDRRGVLAGFAFSSLVYAALLAAGILIIRRTYWTGRTLRPARLLRRTTPRRRPRRRTRTASTGA